jgi:hypothetical protein
VVEVIMLKQCRKIELDKNGRLTPEPDFAGHGCYFFNIHEGCLEDVTAGDVWMFRYKELKDSGRRDKRGKPIYSRVAVPVTKLPFDTSDEANEWFKQMKRIIKDELTITRV